MSFNSFELRTNEGKSYTHAYHTSTISVVNCGGTMDSKGSFIFCSQELLQDLKALRAKTGGWGGRINFKSGWSVSFLFELSNSHVWIFFFFPNVKNPYLGQDMLSSPPFGFSTEFNQKLKEFDHLSHYFFLQTISINCPKIENMQNLFIMCIKMKTEKSHACFYRSG